MLSRNKNLSDYKVTEEQMRYIIDYCKSKDADLKLIRSVCDEVHCGLSDYLFRSFTQGKSYERLGFVPYNKNDFYGLKRKAIYLLKCELFK